MTNKTTILILVAALLSGAAGFWLSQRLATKPDPTELAPQTAQLAKREPTQTIGAMPAFTLPDLTGDSKTPDDYRGKPLLVNFWATWCGPCRKEMPELLALHRERGEQVQVLGIAMDRLDDVQAFVEELGIDYPTLIADDFEGSKLIAEFGNPQGMMPFTVFVDAQGTIRERHLGPITREEAEAKLAAL